MEGIPYGPTAFPEPFRPEQCDNTGDGSYGVFGQVALEFPTKSGQGVKGYSVCSYSAGETYPSDECRRLVL